MYGIRVRKVFKTLLDAQEAIRTENRFFFSLSEHFTYDLSQERIVEI